MAEDRNRLAVLGSPIAHSKSPAIHVAAYRVLGLDWSYDAVEVASGDLGAFLNGCGSSCRGLSLTMPLKREIVPYLAEQDAVSRLVGAANTVLVTEDGFAGFNTDVVGAERMLSESVPGAVRHALILGGGATAGSLLVALANCGASEITVSTRSPEKSTGLLAVADQLGVALAVSGPDVLPEALDVVVSTLPGTAPLVRKFPARLRATVPLVDIAYDPWPTPIARHWLEAAGGVANNGLGMLVYQALVQVRIFVAGDPERELPGEAAVLRAMREAALGSF
ncbi:MAG: shikimate dehydrogenase [Micrococcales bacterium]|nr:shikimate dehydrogenase [Micrococcales bacterium]